MTANTPLATRFTQPTFLNTFTSRLTDYLPTQRWFTSKGKKIATCKVQNAYGITEDSAIAVVRVSFNDGSTEMYQLPLAQLGDVNAQAGYQKDHPGMVVLKLPGGPTVVDAVPSTAFRSALYELIRGQRSTGQGLKTDAGRILNSAPATSPSTVPAIDTSNTAIVYNDEFFFKLFRKLDEGLNPDLELVRFLSERAGFEHCPPYAGSIGVGEMHDDSYLNLGMMSGKVDNRGDAWGFFQELTERFYAGDGAVDDQTLERANLLGKRTAQMHKSLFKGEAAGAMLRPEPMSPEYRAEITAAARKLLNRQMNELRAKQGELTPAQSELAGHVLGMQTELDGNLRKLADRPMDLDLIRIHGDYHLGQVLVTKDDFYIIDFEGEPLLSIPERRRKRPALKDVAGMVRSFHYAARGQLLLNDSYAGRNTAELNRWGERWYKEVSGAYLTAYYAECGAAKFLPASEEDRELLLDLFVLEKAVYEVAYELNSRPAWLAIPLNGVLSVAGPSH